MQASDAGAPATTEPVDRRVHTLSRGMNASHHSRSGSQVPASSSSSNLAGASQSRLTGKDDTKNGMVILDRSLTKSKGQEVSLSAFAFLFSEMVQYSQKRVKGVVELEKKLADIGYRVGSRVFELIMWREKNSRREIRLISLLQFIQMTVWKTLFDKIADGLERSTEAEDEYMIIDNEPLVTKFISVPKELQSGLSCAAFLAGLVEAILDASLCPARVTAHSMPENGYPIRTVILIKIDKTVADRERILS